MRRFAEHLAISASLGWHASRRWFLASLVLAILGPSAVLSVPVAARLFVDHLVRRANAADLVPALLLFAVGATTTWAVAVLDASVSNSLSGEVEPVVVGRSGGAIAGSVTLDPVVSPEGAELVELVRNARYELIQAPRNLFLVLRLVVRVLGIVLILAMIEITLVWFLALALLPFVASQVSGRLRRSFEQEKARDVFLSNEAFRMLSSPQSAGDVRVSSLQPMLSAVHARSSESLIRRETKSVVGEFVVGAFAWILFVGGVILALDIVMAGVAEGRHSIGDAVIVALLAQLVGVQVSEGIPLLNSMAGSLRSIGHLAQLEAMSLDSDTNANANTEVSDDTWPAGTWLLDDVSFRYAGSENPALRNITLRLEPGTTVALVGENGAGKSTLVKLLLGLHRPTSGQIRYVGASGGLAPRGSAAFQDFVRYSLALRSNVGLSQPQDMDRDNRIVDAMGSAGWDPEDELVQDLDMVVGQDGLDSTNLSGGQWQRLAVARGLFRSSPDLLVLDEPTAALDAESEATLFDIYGRVSEQLRISATTVLVLVTHRYATVREADVVVVLHDGEIVEIGPHDQLLAADGHYADLYRMQQKAYE